MKRILLFVALSIIFTACVNDAKEQQEVKSTPTKPKQETQVTTTRTSKLDQAKLLQLVNEYRTRGCKCGTQEFAATTPLAWHDALEQSAQSHADDMAKNNFQANDSSDGTKAGERMKKAGYNWTTFGENIAKGFTSEEQAIKGWIGSAPHCSAIMNPKYTHMGIASNGLYWTQDFAVGE